MGGFEMMGNGAVEIGTGLVSGFVVLGLVYRQA
jgi:hypothetical protein